MLRVRFRLVSFSLLFLVLFQPAVAPEAAPIADVAPSFLSTTLDEGNSEQRQFEIGNVGDADLIWEIAVLYGNGDPLEQPVANYLGIFADSSATTCDGVLAQPGDATLWVVAHVPSFESGVTAFEFSIANLPEDGPGGFVTFDWRSVLVIGDPAVSISMAFTSPLIPNDAGLVVLGSISLVALEEGWPGGDHEMGIAAGSGGLNAVGTDFLEVPIRGGAFTFNCSTDCECPELLADPPEWAEVLPVAGLVLPGESATVTVGFDASGIRSGDHEATVRVTSNDPAAPELDVSLLLHVVGAPDIELDGAPFNFGLVALGTTNELPLTVANVGTEPLEIISIVVDHADFSASASAFTVWPGEAQIVLIGFTPSAEGVAGAVMTMSSNDPAQPFLVFGLNGYGFDPDDPVIAVSPDSLVSHLSVGETESRTLTIANVGEANLDWEIRGPWNRGEEAERSEDLNYIGLFADPAGEICDLDVDLYASPRVHLIAHMPELSSGLVAVSLRIAGFPEDGNGGLVTIDWMSDLEFVDWDALAGLSVELAFIEPQVPDENGNILLGTFDFFATNESWLGVDHLLAARPRTDTGRMVYFDSYFNEHDLPGSHFTFNCTTLCSCYRPGGGPYDWYAVTPISGTIPPGEESTLEVGFDASQLIGGEYWADLVVASDDSANPEVPVSLLLIVTGAPDIRLSADSFEFGEVHVGQSAVLPLEIENAGTDLLSIPVIASDADEFVVSPTSLQLPPGESATVTLTFSPLAVGQASAALLITSNDPDEGELSLTMAGSGFVFTDPVISVDPDSLYTRLPVGGTETLFFLIGNSGVVDLDWSVAETGERGGRGSDAGWFVLDPATGSVAPGEMSPLAIHLDATDLALGEYSAEFTVSSNDPASPEVGIEVGMYVGDEPAIVATPGSFLLHFDEGETWERELILSNPGFADLVWELNLASEADRIADRVPADYVGLFSHDSGGSCDKDVLLESNNVVYILAHVPNFASGIRAAHFRLVNLPLPPNPAFLTFHWEGELHIGDPETDFAIAWSEPVFPDEQGYVRLGSIWFSVENSSWIDSPHVIEVVAPLLLENILLVSGENVEVPVPGSHFTFNCEMDCECYVPEADHWLRVEERNGVLAPGNEVTLPLFFDTEGLPYNDYYDELLLSCNDPIRPEFAIPVRLVVSPSTPALLSRFDLTAEPGIVRLSWELEGRAGEQRLEVSGAGETRSLAFAEESPGSYGSTDDAEVLAAGGEFRYSLYLQSENDWSLLARREIFLEVPAYATALLAPHPNPFNPHTTIPFSLAEDRRVRIAVYNVSGKRVALLADRQFAAGAHRVIWRGVDEQGRAAATGVYFARMEIRGEAMTRKLVLLR